MPAPLGHRYLLDEAKRRVIIALVTNGSSRRVAARVRRLRTQHHYPTRWHRRNGLRKWHTATVPPCRRELATRTDQSPVVGSWPATVPRQLAVCPKSVFWRLRTED